MPWTRREHLKGLLTLAAAASTSAGPAVAAVDAPVPPDGIGRKIRHLSYSDQGGRPDGVQVMLNRRHLYVGHMFSDGVTILDAADPRRLTPVGFFTAGTNTRTHHLQVSGDLLLLANGANIVAMQSYDNMRGYFENALADSITNKKKFRSGLSIHDISKPGGHARDRVSRDARLRHQPPVVDRRPLCVVWRCTSTDTRITSSAIVDLQNITKPEIVSKWWLPGMHRAGGEPTTLERGKRVALHHMIVAGDRGYGAWRDGGFTIHDLSDKTKPKLLSRINWSPPFPGGTHTPLPLPGRNLAVVADEANAEKCAKGLFHTFIVDVRAPENPVPISTLPTPTGRDFCGFGTFGPHNLHENRPGSFQSEETIFATYNMAGVRVFDIRDAVRAEGDRVVDSADAEEADRSASERLAGRKDRRHLRHEGRVDLRRATGMRD